jgi:hypothetical protein
MVPPLSPFPSSTAASGWPCSWARQRLLLERQHDRLAVLLDALVEEHAAPRDSSTCPWPHASDAGFRVLFRRLQQHLRLEERWLSARGCLCPGHRAAHAQVAAVAVADLERGGSDRFARLALLMGLREWLRCHCAGPDAVAYSRADAHADVPTAAMAATSAR